MSSYPPPPQPDQSHYNPVYPPNGQRSQVLDPIAQQDQLHFAAQLAQHAASYGTKVEHEGLDPTTSSQIEQRIEQLQHQQQSEAAEHYHQDHPHDHDHLATDVSPSIERSQTGQHKSPGTKLFRLRKACDSCSIRKVKCDESGPPCKACLSLDIPCTFERPSRRRGPPNRHAEAIKRRKLGDEVVPPVDPGHASPTNAAQALAALSSHPAAPPGQLSAESILPIETIDLLINDYFTYIHPLCPFPHEPSFREAWRRREDYTNRPFLALLSAMVAALVASFPRKPRLHLKAQRREKMYASHADLVLNCVKICSAARGPGYLESPNLSIHDAATSYLLGTASSYIFRWRQGRLYLSECLTIIKALGLHKAQDSTYFHLGGLPSVYGSKGPDHEGSKDKIHDHITLQVSRRVFWAAFVTARSISQVGASNGEMYIPPSTPTDPYPPLPAEVEDFCIFPTHIEPQPPGLLPTISGFNANVRILLSYQPLTVMETAKCMDPGFDWNRQRKVYYDCLLSVKRSIRNFPDELKLLPGSAEIDEAAQDPLQAFHVKMGLRDPALIADGPEMSPEQRRALQREIQKANIYASGLATRLHVVEQYWSAFEARSKVDNHSHGHAVIAGQEQSISPTINSGRLDVSAVATSETPGTGEDEIEAEMLAEREGIIKSLLIVLSNIDRVNMEPNGDSFAHKIRFIASTLLDSPGERKGSVAQRAEEYLKAFLDILVKLEKAGADAESGDGGIGGGGGGGGDSVGGAAGQEEQDSESHHWANLREFQEKFVQQGGVVGLI